VSRLILLQREEHQGLSGHDCVTLLIEQRDKVEGILASSRLQSGGASSGEGPDTFSSKCSVQRASDEVDTPNFQAQADDIMALLANAEDDLRHLKAISRALSFQPNEKCSNLISQTLWNNRRMPSGLHVVFLKLSELYRYVPSYLTRFVAFGKNLGERDDNYKLREHVLGDSFFKALRKGKGEDIDFINDVLRSIKSARFNNKLERVEGSTPLADTANLIQLRMIMPRLCESIGINPTGEEAIHFIYDTAIVLRCNADGLGKSELVRDMRGSRFCVGSLCVRR